MKLICIFLLFTYGVCGQMRLEWKQELSVPGKENSVTGLLKVGDAIILTAKSDANSGFFHFDPTGAARNSLLVSSAWINCLLNAETDQNVYTLGTCEFAKRDLTGGKLNESCLEVENGWSLTTSAAALLKDRLYCGKATYFLKYDKSGNRLLRSSYGTSGDCAYLSAGGNYLYLYSRINQPNLGGRLMQYDTLGNQNWSLPVGDVHAMIADKEGNCYIMIANGETTVAKVNTAGETVWSKLLTGQYAQGASIFGDSLLLCGNISLNAITNHGQSCAYSVMSLSSGQILQQTTLDLYEDNMESENMKHIATDGNAIYIGGTHGSWGSSSCYLLKLSNQGSTTGIHQNKTNSSLSIFPNPGSSKFTVNTGSDVISIYVTVRNIGGQIVYKKQLTHLENNAFTLDLGKQAPGTYTIEVEANGEKTVKKIVVE